jgi:hypothetical protein
MAFIQLTEDPSWVPDTCTLPTTEQPLRVSELDELFRTGVTALERLGPTSLGLTLRPEPRIAAATATLAAREVHCCSFFTFTLTIDANGLQLTVDVPPAHADVLDALAHRAAAPLS